MRWETTTVTSVGALIIGAALVIFSPEEKTLGPLVKFVYVHAALMWVALIFYTLAGVTAAAFIATKQPVFLQWAVPSQQVATIMLLSTFILGLVTAKLAWGAIFWGEPRFRMLIFMLLFSLSVFPAYSLGRRPKVVALLVAAATIAVWVLLLRTQLVFHPRSPILSSDNLAIKAFPVLITATFLVAGLQVVTMLKRRSPKLLK